MNYVPLHVPWIFKSSTNSLRFIPVPKAVAVDFLQSSGPVLLISTNCVLLCTLLPSSQKYDAALRISHLIAGKEFSWLMLVTALHWMKAISVQRVVLKMMTHQCVAQMGIPTGKPIRIGFNEHRLQTFKSKNN